MKLPGSRTQLLGLDTRQQLLEAAIRVFNDDLSATLETIADQAGVTRRTLHRYFPDRAALLVACQQEMWRSCQEATAAAYASTPDPYLQLERLLYASIDCGVKYAFLYKLQVAQPAGPGTAGPFQPLAQILTALQQQQAFQPGLSVAWIQLFFLGIVQATMLAEPVGAVAQSDLKRMAWLSLSQGLGLRPAEPAS